MSYRPGRSARKMYRHKARYGTAGMSKRQLRALAREMDIGVNPRGHRGHRSKPRSRHSKRRTYSDSVTDRAYSHPGRSRRDKRQSAQASKHWSMRSRRASPTFKRMLAEEAEYRLRHNPRVRYYSGRKSTRTAWNPVLVNPRRKFGSSEARAIFKAQQADRRLARAKHRGDGRRASKHIGDSMKWLDRAHAYRSNPKRDGSMTKGEKRLQKHADWLREVADRGRKATMMLKGMRTVPAASHVAMQEHAANKLSEATIEKAMDGEPKAVAKVEQVVEHAEAKFLRQQIADLTMLINSTTEEANSLGEADESMAEELMEQVTKMSKQRKVLKDKATGLGIQTNPRPRRRTVLIGTRAYARALQNLRTAIRRGHR